MFAPHSPPSSPRDPAPLTFAMQTVLNNIVKAKRPLLHTLPPDAAKAQYAGAADILEPPSFPVFSEETYQVSALDGHRILIKLWRPLSLQTVGKQSGAQVSPALIYLHGGGFTIGSVQTHAALCKEIARLSKMIVISVEYRLAPEFTFPTAHTDCWSACDWVFKNALDLKISPRHLFVGGDSAGGTLSLYCAQNAVLEGHRFKGQILFYPGCSATQNMPSHRAYERGYLLEQQTIQYFYDLYHAGPDKLKTTADWRFSALNSPHLNLLPPTWIGLAECDPLRDEGLALANMVQAQGLRVTCKIFRGVVHGFIKMGRFIQEAQESHVDACNFLTDLV